MKEEILNQFKAQRDNYEKFCIKMEHLVKEIIESEGIPFLTITSRVKEVDSLSRKIDLKGDKYNSLSHITDLVGIRVITFLDSDIDRIASILAKEFRKDDFNTIDKRNLEPSEFGYKSYHQILACSLDRCKHSEYRGFNNFIFEVQIRTILQHAWADLVHKLDYKSEESIPLNYKRNFNRIAALLETADIEFDRLKKELTAYKNNASQLLKETLKDVLIDKVTLNEFINQNEVLKLAAKTISDITEKQVKKNDLSWRFISPLNKFFGIYNIGQLEKILADNNKHYIAFASKIAEGFIGDYIDDSVVIYYLLHFMACKRESKKEINEYLEYMSIIKTSSIYDYYIDTKEL